MTRAVVTFALAAAGVVAFGTGAAFGAALVFELPKARASSLRYLAAGAQALGPDLYGDE